MLGKMAPIALDSAPSAVAGGASIFGRKSPPAKALDPYLSFLLTDCKKFVNSSSTLYVVV